jgi:hypothetical protein
VANEIPSFNQDILPNDDLSTSFVRDRFISNISLKIHNASSKLKALRNFCLIEKEELKQCVFKNS